MAAATSYQPEVFPETLEASLLTMYRSRKLRDHRAAWRVLQRAQQDRLGRPEPLDTPQVEVTCDADLPALAWCCRIDGATHRFTVGPGVEVRDDLLYEGVWDGDFATGAVDRTDFAFGSGARIDPAAVVFVPPKHCWEYLYVLHDGERQQTLVSNSLPFVLAAAGVEAGDDLYAAIARDLRQTTDVASAQGIDLYDPKVVSVGSQHLYRMMFTNFTVDACGRFGLRPSAPDVHFTTYSGYRSFLLDTLQRLADNGGDADRRASLLPVTPISNGYDSPAVGSLAAELGFRDAVTLGVVVKGRDDSGADVGAQLGLDVEVVTHPMGENVPVLATSFDGRAGEDIAEFVATAGLGDDMMLGPLESHLRNRILLSGAMGDSAWRRPSRFRSGLPVGVSYGKSFTEFRLRLGYAYVPVPAIGARFAGPLRQLTVSSEMDPWTLRAPYDRPVPRRMVEEAGVPRGAFARAKAATNPTVLNYDELFPTSVSRVMQRYRGRAR